MKTLFASLLLCAAAGTALAQAADIHRLHAQVPVPQAITVAR